VLCVIPTEDGSVATDRASSREREWRPHSDVVTQRLGDKGILVDLRTGAIYELNATGFRIWESLQSGVPLVEIVRLLETEFSAPASEIQADVDGLIARLADIGLFHP
jgi:hypothetical protein